MAAPVSASDTAAYLALAVRIAREAGAQIARTFHAPATGTYDRKSLTDPVTETDRAVEQYVRSEIGKAFPDHRFIGEESAATEEWTDQPTWICDPIDGTANFVHRLPHVCCSIAVTVDKNVIAGVVYNPILDELFQSTHNGPSLLNGSPISVSGVTDLHSACVTAEFGSDRTPSKIDLMVTNLRSLLVNNIQCVRGFGSCALNMCYVACGRIDAYQEYGPHPWDMAAGALIVQRAGGAMKDACGAPFVLTGRSLLACTPGLEHKLIEIHTPRH